MKSDSPGCDEGRDCCDDPCNHFADGFDQPPGGMDPGKWDTSGWTIVANRAVTSTPGADATTKLEADSPSGIVRALWIGGAAGDKFRLKINVDESGDHLLAEFTLAAAGSCGQVALYQSVGGVLTQLGQTRYVAALVPMATHELVLCRSGKLLVGGVLRGTQATTAIYTELDPESFGGLLAGFAAGDTVTAAMAVDNFRHDLHKSGEVPTCGTCNPPLARCAFFVDTFDRANSSDIGCDWEELAGDAEIDGAALVLDDAGSVVKLRQVHPEGVMRYIVNLTIPRTEGEHAARFLFGLEDEENHWFVEWYWNTANGTDDDVLRIGRVVEAEEEILQERAITSVHLWRRVVLEPGVVRVCIGAGDNETGLETYRLSPLGMVFPLGLTTFHGAEALPVDEGLPLYLGLGSGAASARFDFIEVEYGNILLSTEQVGSQCANCPPGCYVCADEHVPAQMQVQLDFGKPTDGTYLLPYAGSTVNFGGGGRSFLVAGQTACQWGPVETPTEGNLFYRLTLYLFQGRRFPSDPHRKQAILMIEKFEPPLWEPPNNWYTAEVLLGAATDPGIDCLAFDRDLSFAAGTGINKPPEYPPTINVQAVT